MFFFFHFKNQRYNYWQNIIIIKSYNNSNKNLLNLMKVAIKIIIKIIENY